MKKRRDDGAIEETRRAYQPYCMAIARHLTGSDEEAEECVSDALDCTLPTSGT